MRNTPTLRKNMETIYLFENDLLIGCWFSFCGRSLPVLFTFNFSKKWQSMLPWD